jgi:hypothetical protein
MKRISLTITLACFLLTCTGVALACEYKRGESKFADYANCRYGEDSIIVVQLPESNTWENCVYYIEAFRPEKLLAVTRTKDGKEVASINARSQIGNPCYLTKKYCDAALKASKQ